MALLFDSMSLDGVGGQLSFNQVVDDGIHPAWLMFDLKHCGLFNTLSLQMLNEDSLIVVGET